MLFWDTSPIKKKYIKHHGLPIYLVMGFSPLSHIWHISGHLKSDHVPRWKSEAWYDSDDRSDVFCTEIGYYCSVHGYVFTQHCVSDILFQSMQFSIRSGKTIYLLNCVSIIVKMARLAEMIYIPDIFPQNIAGLTSPPTNLWTVQ